jgi:hypothetical protein
MTKREKGEDHERVKKKTLGQLLVVKERRGGRMAVGKRGPKKKIQGRG